MDRSRDFDVELIGIQLVVDRNFHLHRQYLTSRLRQNFCRQAVTCLL